MQRNFKYYTLKKYLITYLINTNWNLEEYLMTTKKNQLMIGILNPKHSYNSLQI